MSINEVLFDTVHDCQKVFRELMGAISRPGTIFHIDEYAQKTGEEQFTSLHVIAQTLFTEKTSYMVLGSDTREARSFAGMTRAPLTDANPKYLFCPRMCTAEEIADAFRSSTPGTLVNPHENTTIFILLNDFSGECGLWGPGIDGTIRSPLGEYEQDWILSRDRMRYEYPSGVDLFFISNRGEIIAVPRLVAMIK